MLSSDVFFASGSKHHAGLLGICFPWYRFVFRFHRNVLDKRGQRGGRRTRRRHSHHQRWGQPCARRRKERILHLDCRGSCAALSCPLFPSFNPCISLSFSLCLPLFFSTSDHCPRRVNEEPAGSPQTEKFPKCFPIIAFCLSFTSCPFFLFSFFGSRFPQAAYRRCPEVVSFVIFFLIFLTWMPGSLYIYHDCFLHEPFFISSPVSRPSRHPNTHCIPRPLFTHVHKHISYLTSTRCLKIQTPLNFCQCLHVSSVSSNVNAL